MFLDLDPPDDGAVGMDARISDGGSAGCARDVDCDDGVFCNGFEVCDAGGCVPGEPPLCDDGINCTADRCDDGVERCVLEPVDEICGDTLIGCTSFVCDPDLGCQRIFDDSVCDDGIDCTFEACNSDGCESVPNDGMCREGEYCDPAFGGCRPPPTCANAGDCPPRMCNHPASCDEGRCVYNPSGFDPECSVIDPCTPAICESGACLIGPSEVCSGITDTSSCSNRVCMKDAAGSVFCGDVDRDGETCATSGPCTAGTCIGTECTSRSTCIPSDSCFIADCLDGSTCSLVPFDCGANATCSMDAVGMASCACDPGWSRCSVGSLGCECATTSDAGVDSSVPVPDGGSRCPPCRSGETCCAATRTCYRPGSGMVCAEVE